MAPIPRSALYLDMDNFRAPASELPAALLARRIQARAIELLAEHPPLLEAIESGEALLRIVPATPEKAKIDAVMVPHRLRASPEGRHYGREIMSAILMAADEQGCPIELLARPLPMEPEPGKPATIIPLSKLAAFYASFGFEEVPGSRTPLSAKMRRAAAKPTLGSAPGDGPLPSRQKNI